MRKIYFLLLTILFAAITNAQVSGTKTIGVDYPNLAAAVTALNTSGVGAGGAIINVPAGWTETAPSGGYVLGSTVLNSSLSAANTLVIKKSGAGANPMLTAFTGGSSTTADGIFKLAGVDYVTIDGINLQENSANSGNALMEWGYALVNLNAAPPFDGCQNVTIQNTVVTLERTNPNGSFGFYSGHHVASNNTALTITATTDAHSNNKIYGNNISNCTFAIFFLGFNAASPYTLYDQNNDIGGSSPATGNTISNIGNLTGFNSFGIYLAYHNGANASYNNISYFQGFGSTAVAYGIYFFGTNSTATANNNIIAVGQAAGSGNIAGIYAVNSGSIVATNNNITFTDAGTGSGSHYGIYTASATTANISSNTFNASTAAAVTGIYYFIYDGTTGTGETFNNNIFNNININTTGTTYLIYASNGTPNVTATGNSVTGSVVRTGATGTFYGYYNFGSPSGGTANISGNNFSNISLSGSTTGYGIYQATSTTQVENINNNTISNITTGTGTFIGIHHNYGAAGSTANGNTVSNISGAGIVTGIQLGNATASLGLTVSNNNINTLSTTGASTVTGMIHTTGANSSIFKNKIYDITANNASGIANGLTIAGGTTVNVYNNLIGNLMAPQTNSATDAARGINITSTTTSTSIIVSYNTIYLNASSSGTNFGTSGVFHTASTTATTANLTMRNNIIYNNSFAKGTGFVTAFRRSSGTAGTLANYNAASNNNLFFAGAPGPNQLIYYDGTSSAQTLAAYQAGVFTAGTIAPRDNASVTELSTPFLSTVGSNANFLHLSTAIPTVAESAGVNIPSITDDYDGDTRNVTTPDIGADEFNGLAPTACSGTPVPGTINGLNNICAGQYTVLNLTGYTVGTGISLQWQSSAVSGGPYTDIPGATGASYNTGVIPTGTTVYYVVKVTCANGGANATTTQFSVTSNPAPTITVNPPSPTICSGGTGVNLTASGASTYVWSPATGLSATTGATVNANPSATTTYTVVGTNAFSCSNSTTVTVTVNPSPVITSVTATPNSVCEGGTSQLQVNLQGPGTYCASTHSSGCGFGDEITLVVLNTLNNPSGCASSAYTYFPPTGSATTTLTAGNTYTLSVSFGSDGNQYFGAWIDYNNDGVLAASEFLGASGNAGSNGTTSITFTVPAGALNGFARLRIVGGNDSPVSSGQACGASSSSFGETEDYDLTITGGLPQYTYSWSPSTFLNSTTIPNPVASNVTATTTYTVTVGQSINSCTASANVTVTMKSPVISNSTVVQPSTCVSNDGSITLTVTGGTGGTGPYTFAWSGSGTGINPTAQNQSGLSVGTYTVVITDVPSGCTTTQSFALLGPGGCICPTISSLTTNPTPNGCINTNVTLNATGLANMGTAYGILFKYSTTPLGNPYVGGTVIGTVSNASLTAGGTAATFTTSFATANTYYIYAVLSPTPPDPTCRPSQSVTLPVYGNPSITSQPVNRTICSGQNTTFAVTTTGTPVTYQWQINQGAGFVNLSEVAPFSGTQTATLTVTGATTVYNGNTFRCVIGPCGGAISNIVTLTVNPLPIITVGPDGLCAPVTLIAAGNSNTYSWSPATGLSATTGSTVIATPAVNTTYTVTGTITATGCQNSATVNVRGNSTAAVLSGTATICNGQSTNLVVNITGGVGPFTVVYNNGTGNVTVNNYNSGANIPVSPSTTTTYTLVSVTGANGCAGGGINTTPITVTVNPLPTISVGPNNQCSPVTLTATGTSNTYSWSPATGLSATTGATVTATTTATITYTVTGTITATGCQNTATVTVLGKPNTPVLSPTAANICLGSIVQLNATATPAAVWSPTTGLYTDVTATTPYTGTALNTVYAKPTTNTTYSVTSTSGTCTSPAATITVTVTQPLSITTQPANVTVCAGANPTFSVVTAGTLQTYQWQLSTDGGTTYNNLTNNATYNNVNAATLNITNATTAMNSYRYRVVVSNSCATVTSNAATLTVNALPVVTATALTNRICISDTLVNLVGSPIGGVWSGIGVYGNTFVPMRTAIGTYTLTYTYTNANNCTNTTTVVAKVEDCPERIREIGDKGVLLYPNPNNGQFNLRVNSTLYNYLGMRVFTMSGNLVSIKSWSNLQYGRIIPVDLSKLPAGVYQVKVFYDDGIRTAEKTFNVVIAH
jgi:hypothetical protein